MAALRQPTRRGRPQQCQEDNIMLQQLRKLGSSSTRRSFLRTGLAAPGAIGAALIADRLPSAAFAASGLTSGDASILRFLSAIEILETDLWQQYNELGGIQDEEVPGGSETNPIPTRFRNLMRICRNISMTTPRTNSRTSTLSTHTLCRRAPSPPTLIDSARCRAAPRPARRRSSASPTSCSSRSTPAGGHVTAAAPRIPISEIRFRPPFRD